MYDSVSLIEGIVQRIRKITGGFDLISPDIVLYPKEPGTNNGFPRSGIVAGALGICSSNVNDDPLIVVVGTATILLLTAVQCFFNQFILPGRQLRGVLADDIRPFNELLYKLIRLCADLIDHDRALLLGHIAEKIRPLHRFLTEVLFYCGHQLL